MWERLSVVRAAPWDNAQTSFKSQTALFYTTFYMNPQKNAHPWVGYRYGLRPDAVRHFRVKQAESWLWRRGWVGNKKLLRETSHCETTSCYQAREEKKEAHSGSLTGVSLSVNLNRLITFFIYYCAASMLKP